MDKEANEKTGRDLFVKIGTATGNGSTADLRKEKRTQDKPRPKTKPQTTSKRENQKAEPTGSAARTRQKRRRYDRETKPQTILLGLITKEGR